MGITSFLLISNQELSKSDLKSLEIGYIALLQLLNQLMEYVSTESQIKMNDLDLSNARARDL